MLETLKKTILAGVGATVLSANAVKNTLEELVKKGKISPDEAKAAFDKAASRGEEDLKAFYDKASSRGKDAIDSLTRATQLAAIERRLAAIEEKLGIVPAPAPAAPEAPEAPAAPAAPAAPEAKAE